MQTATSETESKSLDLSICVHHYTSRAPCPKGQGKEFQIGLCGASAGPIWNSFATVGVRDFWENGCMVHHSDKCYRRLTVMPKVACARIIPHASRCARRRPGEIALCRAH